MSEELNLEEIEARCEKNLFVSLHRNEMQALIAEVRRLRSIVECRTYCCEAHQDERERNKETIQVLGLKLAMAEKETEKLRDWQNRAAAEIREEAHDECRCDRCIRRCALLSELEGGK